MIVEDKESIVVCCIPVTRKDILVLFSSIDLHEKNWSYISKCKLVGWHWKFEYDAVQYEYKIVPEYWGEYRK